MYIFTLTLFQRRELMLQKGQVYDALITDTTMLGSGVTRISAFAVFVSGALTGDECRIEITDVKKSFALAKVLEILTPSENRIENDCPLFPRCGGCAFRSASYDFEGKLKRSAVEDAFRKAGVTVGKVNDTVQPPERGYRNKVTFHFDKVGRVGFYESSSNTLLPLSGCSCALASAGFCEIAEETSRFLVSGSIAPPTEMMLRRSDDGKVHVALTGVKNQEAATIAEHIMASHRAVIGVSSRVSSKERYKPVAGDGAIVTSFCGLDFRVSPEAFFQVNYEGAERLFGCVTDIASREGFTRCADLYCGTGTIGMILASRFKDARFWGVEINASAVEDAKYNAKANGLDNISFYCGDAGKFSADGELDLVLVDPPRAGLSESMTEILGEIGSERIIYVSCNPFTLARDVKRLESYGYRATEATPVNMFPRSEHCEVVCALEKH